MLIIMNVCLYCMMYCQPSSSAAARPAYHSIAVICIVTATSGYSCIDIAVYSCCLVLPNCLIIIKQPEVNLLTDTKQVRENLLVIIMNSYHDVISQLL